MDIIDRIALDLKLDKSYLARIASRSAFYYRDFKIKKRNGGERYLAQPSPELKTLQYWVLNNVLNKIPVSKAACAYKKGNSIKKHAQLHSKSRFVFHADICDFFPSVHSSHLNDVLRIHKNIFDDLDLDLESSILDIKKICFRKDALCIGAVSSPAISNIIMSSFDSALLDYCKAKNYIYSRYADDIKEVPCEDFQFVFWNITSVGCHKATRLLFHLLSGHSSFTLPDHTHTLLILFLSGIASVGHR